MLTKSDKKFILDSIKDSIKENNGVLVKEMVDLFNANNAYIKEVDERLNEKIDKVEEKITEKIDKVEDKLGDKIDKVLDALKTEDQSIDDHEIRINKLEDKVFTVSA